MNTSESVFPRTSKTRRRGFTYKLVVASSVAAAALGLFLTSESWSADEHAPGERDLVELSSLNIDLARPDALIESENLAQLPRDLTQAPMLKDVLNEDFVFYYEQHPDRLSILGSLRRIAYEQKLDFAERFVVELLSQPAQVALYRGAGGKLEHALFALKRGALARSLQPLARVAQLGSGASADTQLTQIGMLNVGAKMAPVAVPVYRLAYSNDRAILFVAYQDRLLVLSASGMLLGANGRLARPAAAVLENALSSDLGFAQRFAHAPPTGAHRITVSADTLALGYGALVPDIDALSIASSDLQHSDWHSDIAVLPTIAALDTAPLWQAMPMGASACAAAPISAKALAPVLAGFVRSKLLDAALVDALQGPIALCWYQNSRLHTPLIVTRIRAAGGGALDAALANSFSAAIGANEAKLDTHRFPVEAQTSLAEQASGQTGAIQASWQRVVGSSFGRYPAAEFAHPEQLEAAKFFRVSLARYDDMVVFSLDDMLVKRAQQTLQKRFPALAESLPKTGAVPLYLAPSGLAELLQEEARLSLPQDREEVLRNAMQARLLPVLSQLAKKPPFALRFDAATAAEVATQAPRAANQSVEWKALTVERAPQAKSAPGP
jgi:uncharacterized protein YfaA (DUF2138 family)